MKILYILSGTNLGGATFSFLSLLEQVIKLGDSAIVVIPDSRPEFVEILQHKKVKYYVSPLPVNSWPAFFGVKRLLGYPFVLIREQLHLIKSRQRLKEIVRIESPDIIHTNVSPIDIGHRVARETGIPHIWHIREYCDLDFKINVFPSKCSHRRKLLKDYTICITKNLQNYNHLTECNKSYVVYNGVRHFDDISFCPDKQKYFVMASRVSEEKGHERTIQVFARFSKEHTEYKLIILGEGYDYFVNRCKKLCMQLEVADKVVFEGFTDDVDSYLRVATALLVASPAEGFGRMTAEAAFSGCIVIGYNSAGTKEILDSTGGYLWSSDKEYYDAMEKVSSLSEEEYRVRINKAQNAARELFSIESYVGNVTKIYEKAIAG